MNDLPAGATSARSCTGSSSMPIRAQNFAPSYSPASSSSCGGGRSTPHPTTSPIPSCPCRSPRSDPSPAASDWPTSRCPTGSASSTRVPARRRRPTASVGATPTARGRRRPAPTPARDDPMRAYAERLETPSLGDQLLRGYLSGSIDVVLRVPERLGRPVSRRRLQDEQARRPRPAAHRARIQTPTSWPTRCCTPTTRCKR